MGSGTGSTGAKSSEYSNRKQLISRMNTIAVGHSSLPGPCAIARDRGRFAGSPPRQR
jgi:hypothetical protein